MIKIDVEKEIQNLRDKSPDQIIDWALTLTNRRIVTTSFGVYSSVLLSTFARKDPDIDVVWCDSGYNSDKTYEHAHQLIHDYKLNINIYVPKHTKAFTNISLGLPSLGDPKHDDFTELVKLEPFRRALDEHQPEVWFTNIRVRQTEYRSSLDILSYTKEGILKVSPFYYWTDEDLDEYLSANSLPKNTSYFDPVKALQSRECGIHLIG